jgi:hypothetical protein
MWYLKGYALEFTLPGEHFRMRYLRLQWNSSRRSARNFAATQTDGIKGSRYYKYNSKMEAEAAYRQAQEEQLTTVLQ